MTPPHEPRKRRIIGPSGFALWLNRDFALLTSGHAISFAGTQVQEIALPLLLLSLTGSTLHTGFVLGLATAAPLLVSLIGGALVDRWDRKRTMIATDLLRALLVATIVAALWLDRLSLVQLSIVVVGTGVLSSVFSSATTAALPNVVGDKSLPQALSQTQAAISTVRVFGASLGGLLFAFGRSVPFVANTFSFLVSAVTLGFIHAPFQEREASAARTLRSDIAAGIAFLFRQRVLRFLTLMMTANALRFSGAYLVIIVLAQTMGASSVGVGAVFSAAAVGALTGSVASAWVQQRFRFGRIAITMLWVNALVFPLYAAAPSVLWLGVVAAAESVLSPIFHVALNGYQLRITPDRLRGRMTSAVRTLVGAAQPLGILVTGALLAALGPKPTILVLGAWLLLIAIVTTANRDVRRATGHAEDHGVDCRSKT